MSIQTQTALREAARDFAMVSAFGFWAVVIGFAPVAAIRMLMAGECLPRCCRWLIGGSTCGQIRAKARQGF